MKYLRSKINGLVLEFSERLAANPDVELVTEQEAFPEKFAPATTLNRRSSVKLDVPAEVVQEPEVSPELAAQRGVTFADAGTKFTKANKLSAPEILGLVGEG